MEINKFRLHRGSEFRKGLVQQLLLLGWVNDPDGSQGIGIVVESLYGIDLSAMGTGTLDEFVIVAVKIIQNIGHLKGYLFYTVGFIHNTVGQFRHFETEIPGGSAGIPHGKAVVNLCFPVDGKIAVGTDILRIVRRPPVPAVLHKTDLDQLHQSGGKTFRCPAKAVDAADTPQRIFRFGIVVVDVGVQQGILVPGFIILTAKHHRIAVGAEDLIFIQGEPANLPEIILQIVNDTVALMIKAEQFLSPNGAILSAGCFSNLFDSHGNTLPKISC